MVAREFKDFRPRAFVNEETSFTNDVVALADVAASATTALGALRATAGAT